MSLFRCGLVALLASGCEIAFPIEPVKPDAAIDPTTPPRVYASPGAAPMIWGGFPHSFSITLAADLPGTNIYYTLDGTTPDTSSTSSVTPIKGITISATTTVKYFGVHGTGTSAVASDTLTFDTASSMSNAGFLVTGLTLDGNSPVVIATAGSSLTAKANVQTWVQAGCSACAAQVVYGVDTDDQGCLFDGGPGLYPGTTTNGKSFTIKVPSTSGVHEVKLAHIEQTSCAAAMNANSLATRPTVSRIGVIIVP
jgi:hypothetical protein